MSRIIASVNRKGFFALILFLAISIAAGAQGFLRAKGKNIVNEKGVNMLLRGMGLGGWMLQEGYMLRINKAGQQHKMRAAFEELAGKETTDEFYEAWLNNHTTKADIDSLKAWGFNSVRLPMHYNLYTLPVEKEPVAGNNTWLEKGFLLTDNLLNWCKANDMYLILDLHATPGGQGSDLNISDADAALPNLWQSQANKNKTIALWKKIASRYANEPNIGAYDIINEPNWGFQDTVNDKNGLKETGNKDLKQLMQDITKAIREVDEKHIIIIEGNGWGNNYSNMLPAWDNNMVLSFHKYWNYNDDASIQHMLNFREKYDIPVWLGETGENSNTWFTDAIRLLETNNIGWAWWPLKKIGINNPLEIVSNADYDSVANYLNGITATKPSKEQVRKALMALAHSTKNQNNIYHKDVTDAMMRQPFLKTAQPFKATSVGNKLSINAADYDLGANGIAYYDNDTADYHVSTGRRTAGNRGRMYRNDGVDIYNENGKTGDTYIGNIEEGEWLQYTIFVSTGGKYDIGFETAGRSGGTVTVMLDDKIPVKLLFEATATELKWAISVIKNMPLSAGTHSLRVKVEKGGFNFKSMHFDQH